MNSQELDLKIQELENSNAPKSITPQMVADILKMLKKLSTNVDLLSASEKNKIINLSIDYFKDNSILLKNIFNTAKGEGNYYLKTLNDGDIKIKVGEDIFNLKKEGKYNITKDKTDITFTQDMYTDSYVSINNDIFGKGIGETQKTLELNDEYEPIELVSIPLNNISEGDTVILFKYFNEDLSFGNYRATVKKNSTQEVISNNRNFVVIPNDGESYTISVNGSSYTNIDIKGKNIQKTSASSDESGQPAEYIIDDSKKGGMVIVSVDISL